MAKSHGYAVFATHDHPYRRERRIDLESVGKQARTAPTDLIHVGLPGSSGRQISPGRAPSRTYSLARSGRIMVSRTVGTAAGSPDSVPPHTQTRPFCSPVTCAAPLAAARGPWSVASIGRPRRPVPSPVIAPRVAAVVNRSGSPGSSRDLVGARAEAESAQLDTLPRRCLQLDVADRHRDCLVEHRWQPQVRLASLQVERKIAAQPQASPKRRSLAHVGTAPGAIRGHSRRAAPAGLQHRSPASSRRVRGGCR